MGVTTNTDQFSCPISPSRMFHALFIDAHNLMPKLLPQAIKSVNIVSGDGGPGSIQQINFPDAGSPFKYVKHRLDVLDKDNLVCKYSVIEGDVLEDKLDFIAFEIKFESVANGGCVCKMTSNHHTKGDAEISNEEIMAAKEKGMGMYKRLLRITWLRTLSCLCLIIWPLVTGHSTHTGAIDMDG